MGIFTLTSLCHLSAIVSIEKVPVEIYSMLNSIINGDPIVPISPDDFSGETVTIA